MSGVFSDYKITIWMSGVNNDPASRLSTEWSHNTQNSIILNELEDYMYK